MKWTRRLLKTSVSEFLFLMLFNQNSFRGTVFNKRRVKGIRMYFFISFLETKALITYSRVFQKAKGIEILRLLCSICILIKINSTLF